VDKTNTKEVREWPGLQRSPALAGDVRLEDRQRLGASFDGLKSKIPHALMQ